MNEQISPRTRKKEAESEASTPVHVVRQGAIAASIWLRQSPSGFGFYDYTLSRSWKAKSTGKAGYSKSFFAANRENLIAVIEEVSAWIAAHPLEATGEGATAEPLAA